MSSHIICKSILFSGLVAVFILCQEIPHRLPPSEVFCLDSYCNKRISQARTLKDLFSDGKLVINKDTVVDVVAKSALSEDSQVKIMHNGHTAYVDSTLVIDISGSETRGLKRFSNTDAKVSPGNQTPDMASPSPAKSASESVKIETVIEQNTPSAKDVPKHTPKTVPATEPAKVSSSTSDVNAIVRNSSDPSHKSKIHSTVSQPKGVHVNVDISPERGTPSIPSPDLGATPQQNRSDKVSVKPTVSVNDTLNVTKPVQLDEPNSDRKGLKAMNVTKLEIKSTMPKDGVSKTAGTSDPSGIPASSNVGDMLAVGGKDGSERSTPLEEQTSSNVTTVDSNLPSNSENNNTYPASHSRIKIPLDDLANEPLRDEKTTANSPVEIPSQTQSTKTVRTNSSPSHLSVEDLAGSAREEAPKSDSIISHSGLPSSESTTKQSSPAPQSADLKTFGTGNSADFDASLSSDVSTDPPSTISNEQRISEHVEEELRVSKIQEHTNENMSESISPPTGAVDTSLQSDLPADSTSSIPSSPKSVLNDHVADQDQPDRSAKRDSHSDAGSSFECQTARPIYPSFLKCIAWAVNETRKSPDMSDFGMWSPLSVLMRRLLQITEHLLSSYVPDPIRYIAEQTTTNVFLLPFDAVVVLLFLFITLSLFGCLIVKNVILSLFGLSEPRGVTRKEYSKAEEEISQLSSRLLDQEKINSQLTDWANKLCNKLKNVQTKHSEEVESLQKLIDVSKIELSSVNEKLTESLKKCTQLEVLEGQLSEKEQIVTKLDADLNKFQEERCVSEQNWETKFADLKELHKKAMDDAKQEQEDLYHQAMDYYNRMKAMQPEMDKLIEARKQAEDKVASLETELNSLRTTFTTLKSFELALEQEATLTKQKSTTSVEQSDYMLVEGSVESDTESIKPEVDECKLGSETKSQPSSCAVSADTETEGEGEQQESKLRANLALFLDVGRLQAELMAAQNQVKSEEARAHCEHELRLTLEEKVEQIERENCNLRTKCSQAIEEKTAAQTRLEVLSAYFKEREVEMQKDLGKHVVVGSESTEALSTFRKRNKELEAELKASRDQLNSLRRELGETERINRRQVSELDKKSHENWLAARAADHQVKELRDENNLLRQKLLEAERALLPPALRSQQMSQVRIPFPLGKLPSGVTPRPLIRNPLSISSGRLEKRSLSGHSLTSLSSQTSVSRPDVPNLPFPVPPPPPPPPMPLPRNMSPSGSQPPIPPFIPGISPNRIPLPPGFPPPPPPPPFMLNNHNAQMSPSSSVAGSLGRPVT